MGRHCRLLSANSLSFCSTSKYSHRTPKKATFSEVASVVSVGWVCLKMRQPMVTPQFQRFSIIFPKYRHNKIIPYKSKIKYIYSVLYNPSIKVWTNQFLGWILPAAMLDTPNAVLQKKKRWVATGRSGGWRPGRGWDPGIPTAPITTEPCKVTRNDGYDWGNYPKMAELFKLVNVNPLA